LVAGFRNQTYEGNSMLVLVYHFQDTEAARAIQAHADGTRVLGVAALFFSTETRDSVSQSLDKAVTPVFGLLGAAPPGRAEATCSQVRRCRRRSRAT